MAAAKGKVHVVRTLVRANAKPWLKDEKGFTALHYAAMKPCNVAIIEAIAAHPVADIDVEASLPNRPAGVPPEEGRRCSSQQWRARSMPCACSCASGHV